ncbi:MAG: hypothetical protein KDA84_09320, partial [Planctomycetaceae bacterium]|nr:hypothetical protein [Planctomycetaceae bacterium]
TLISLSDDRDISVWNSENGKRLKSIRVHKQSALDFVVDSSNSLLLTLSPDGIRRVTTVTSEPYLARRFQASDVYTEQDWKESFRSFNLERVRWSSSGHRLIVNTVMHSDRDGKQRTWFYDTAWNSIGINKTDALGGTSLNGGRWSSNGGLLRFSGRFKDDAYEYDFGLRRRRYLGPSNPLVNYKTNTSADTARIRLLLSDIHPTGRLVAKAEEFRPEPITIQEVGGKTRVCELMGHHGMVTDVDWNPGGMRLASSGEDGTIRIWDGSTGRQLLSLTAKGVQQFHSVAWSPDGLQLAASSRDGQFFIWGSESMERPRPSSTGLKTGKIAKFLAGPDDGDPAPLPTPVFGWKPYTVELQGLLKTTVQEPENHKWNESWQSMLHAIAKNDDPQQARRDFVLAATHLLEADKSPAATDWLAERLIETLTAEVTKQPQSLAAWNDLVEANLVIAHLDRDRSSAHYWAGAAYALSKVIELNPDDELSKSRLAFISAKKLNSPEQQ